MIDTVAHEAPVLGWLSISDPVQVLSSNIRQKDTHRKHTKEGNIFNKLVYGLRSCNLC